MVNKEDFENIRGWLGLCKDDADKFNGFILLNIGKVLCEIRDELKRLNDIAEREDLRETRIVTRTYGKGGGSDK